MRGVLHIYADVGDAIDKLQRLSYFADNRCVVIGREKQGQPYSALSRRRDVANHFGFEHVGADAIVADARQRIGDALLQACAHFELSTVRRTARSSVIRSLS